MKKNSVGLLELEMAVLECFLEKTPLSPLGVKTYANSRVGDYLHHPMSKSRFFWSLFHMIFCCAFNSTIRQFWFHVDKKIPFPDLPCKTKSLGIGRTFPLFPRGCNFHCWSRHWGRESQGSVSWNTGWGFQLFTSFLFFAFWLAWAQTPIAPFICLKNKKNKKNKEKEKTPIA
jgi:hypothetical protein